MFEAPISNGGRGFSLNCLNHHFCQSRAKFLGHVGATWVFWDLGFSLKVVLNITFTERPETGQSDLCVCWCSVYSVFKWKHMQPTTRSEQVTSSSFGFRILRQISGSEVSLQNTTAQRRGPQKGQSSSQRGPPQGPPGDFRLGRVAVFAGG